MLNGKTRESIMTALFAKLQTAAGFNTYDRRMRLWNDISAADKPALFMQEARENVVQMGEGVPYKNTMSVNVWIYTEDGKDPTSTPIIALNNLIDAVETTLTPDSVYGNKLTLGGLVAHCWIEGEIIKEPGDFDGDGIAVIPIKILIP